MSIKIKKSKQGSLHKHLGVPQGKKIPASKLKIKSTDSPAIRKKKQFAINAKKWKHEEGGLVPEYSWGGVLADTAAGAGMGALAGSVAPGIGTAIGAVIGGAGAFIKGAAGEIAGNKEEQLQLAKQRVDQTNANFNTMMGSGLQNPFTATFAMGGKVGMINAEIEKGETALSPNGTMHKFQLPSHANSVGDNFKSFDPGTMIFSDKLKFSKNKTFAQEQNRWLKLSAKADKTIKNPGSTFLNKRTANLNKQNSLKMSVDLFGKQEAMKMSKGGSVSGKYPDGGGIPRLPYPGYTTNGVPYPTAENTYAAMMYPYNQGMQNHPINIPQVNVIGNAQTPANAGVVNSINNPINLPDQYIATDRTQQQYPMPLPHPDPSTNPYLKVNRQQSYTRQTGFPFADELFNRMQGSQPAAYQPGTDNTGWRMPGVRDAARPTAPVAPPIGGNTSGTGVAPVQDDFIASQMELMKYNAPTSPDMNIDVNAAMQATDAAHNASPVNYAGLANQFDQMGVQPLGTPKTNWGGIGMQALALAPDIYNLGHALFSKPEKIERSRYFNPYTNQIRSRMNDRRFNIDPILAANRNANAVYNRNVSNASGGDRSRLMSNLLAGMTGRQGADAAAYSQKNNMDNQYAAEQAQMDYNLGAMNAQALAMRDDINARNLAAKRNYGASAASGMQQYALNQMQMNNQLASQRAYLDVLQRSNPFFNQWLGIDDLRSYGKYNR